MGVGPSDKAAWLSQCASAGKDIAAKTAIIIVDDADDDDNVAAAGDIHSDNPGSESAATTPFFIAANILI